MEKIRDHTEAKPTDTPMLLHYLPTKRLNLLSPPSPQKDITAQPKFRYIEISTLEMESNNEFQSKSKWDPQLADSFYREVCLALQGRGPTSKCSQNLERADIPRKYGQNLIIPSITSYARTSRWCHV